MASNYFGFAAANGPYAAQPAYPAGQATYVSAGQAFAAAANARPAYQTYETGPAANAYAYAPPRPAVVTVAVTPQYQAGYDAALYSAATNYYQQHHVPGKTSGTNQWLNSSGNKDFIVKKTAVAGYQAKPKGPPKTPQLHYCDICKISCAGPQTYREHLEGQKHKKKEAAAASGNTTANVKAGQSQLRCELCTVSCTGTDAYAAHVRGSKHQKVLKLHVKLGKPIPSANAVIVQADGKTAPVTSTASAINMSASAASTSKDAIKLPEKTAMIPSVARKMPSVPVVKFVGGSALKTADYKDANTLSEKSAGSLISVSIAKVSDPSDGLLPGEKLSVAVGHEYVEELKNEAGKVVSFNCKLCDCKFNDPNAKDMHMKGRRHRLQYKKKVDPSLQVDIKAGGRQKKLQEERQWRLDQRDTFSMRRREADNGFSGENRSFEQEHYYQDREQDEDVAFYGPTRTVKGPPEDSDDCHITARHADIYPKEEELLVVQNIVTACEKALKLASDQLSVPGGNREEAGIDEMSNKVESPLLRDNVQKDKRQLKGVMRLGALVKGLVLSGDLNVNLVLMCSDKPTQSLLGQVTELLPQMLKDVTEEVYQVRQLMEEAAILVSRTALPTATCTITLTSPLVREFSPEEQLIKDPLDALDRHKCLDALAALRHAKWFQARASPLPACVILIRILRDLRKKVSSLSALNEWAIELLVEHCISSSVSPVGLSGALKRVMECLASGILLPGGPGLLDPCEKEPSDAAGMLTLQQRDDITAYAQKSLRQLAFGQISQVLSVELSQANELSSNPCSRKRPHTDYPGNSGDDVEIKKEKTEPNRLSI